VNRILRRTLPILALAAVVGTVVAMVLSRLLDEAVTGRVERDFVTRLDRLAPEFEGASIQATRSEEAQQRVRLLARELGARVTLIAADGRVVADSEVSPAELPRLENHARRPEVLEARARQVGFGRRRSATVGEPYLYIARRLGPAAAPLGTLRIAISQSEIEESEAPFRRQMGALSASMGLLVGILVFLGRRQHTRELALVRQAIGAAAAGSSPELPARLSEESEEVFSALERFAQLVRAEREGSERAKALARTVFEQVPAGLVVVDRSLHVLDANPALYRLFGMVRGRAESGVPLLDLIRSHDLIAAFRRGLDGETVESEAVRFETEPGVDRFVEVTLRPLSASRPGEPAAVGVLRDVTDRERLDGLRRRFVADVSHELRTPIASVRAAAETLAAEPLPEEAVPFVSIVKRQAEQMQDLVSDLMDLSLIEAGAITMQLDRLPIASVLRSVAEDLAEVGQKRSVAVGVSASDDLYVHADRRRLAQVFRNLVDNAIKFSPMGARVEVRAEAGAGSDAARVLIHVEDRGIGIPRADQDRIFQRFYRVDPSRTKSTPGTGLGLAIVKHLLILHGGSVRLESEPGRGSRFTVVLPAVVPAQEVT